MWCRARCRGRASRPWCGTSSLAFHEAGKRVAVVDLDLRHPALPKLFGVRIAPGITDVLRRDKKLDEVMFRSARGSRLDDLLDWGGHERRTQRHERTRRRDDSPRRIGASAGRRDAGRSACGAGIEPARRDPQRLRGRFDIVLIDSAPVLAVTDTVPLLRYADATLFVGRLGVTTRDTAKRLADFVARVPDLNMLGVVANDLSRLEAGTYGYGYGYGYDPGREEAAARPRPPSRRGRTAEAAGLNAPAEMSTFAIQPAPRRRAGWGGPSPSPARRTSSSHAPVVGALRRPRSGTRPSRREAAAPSLLVVAGGLWFAGTRRTQLALALFVLYLGLLDGYLKLASGSNLVTFVRDLLLYAIVVGLLVRAIVQGKRLPLPR